MEHLVSDFTLIPSYVAISYPWRDLQLPVGTYAPSFSVEGASSADPISIDVVRTACLACRAYGSEFLWLDRLCILQASKEDKSWQIQHMFQIYKHCNVCLVFPGGLVRLASFDDSTTWIDRAWTLQEAAAPGNNKVKLVIQLKHPSFEAFLRERCDTEKYSEGYSRYLLQAVVRRQHEGRHMTHGYFIDQIIEDDKSAACDLDRLARLIFDMDVALRNHAPESIAKDHRKQPIRVLRSVEAKILRGALRIRSPLYFWMASYTRSSSRPIDMVFSLMDLLGVNLEVAKFGENDRYKATVAMIQALMKASPNSVATFLFIAPTMAPSKELSLLPQMPETSVSGRAYILTARRERVLASEAIGVRGSSLWGMEGAPRGEMTDAGYFVFWSRAVLVKDSISQSDRLSHRDRDDRERWAIVVGNFKNLNRHPETFEVRGTPFGAPKPEGLYEMTLMFVEKHGYGLYHRIGMEREIDERKTRGWDWKYRCFQVGGPGRGQRIRFSVSISGPTFVPGLGEEEIDHTIARGGV